MNTKLENVYKQQIIRRRKTTVDYTNADSLTQQQFVQQSDINHIMKSYNNNINYVPPFQSSGQYLDTSNLPQSYNEALNFVIDANDKFAQLPAEIRNRFSNDPENLLKFIGDSNNREEAIKLGIISAPNKQQIPTTNDTNQKQNELNNKKQTTPQNPE